MTKNPDNSVVTGGSQWAVQALWPLLALGLLVLLLVSDSGLVIEVSAADFFVVTILLGGGAAWLSGRAIAETWRPYRQLLVYMALLAAAVRFIHFALFEGTLLSLQFYAMDFIVLAAFASVGYRRMRARQMALQYGWLYRQTGPLGWSRAPDQNVAQPASRS